MTPFDPHLLDALEASQVDEVSGTVWRQILEPTSVMRPNQRGARWNPAGTEALYCSLAPDTAAAEITHLITQQSIPITRQRITWPITVSVSRVVDLRPEPWAAQFGYEYDPTDIDQCRTIGAATAWLDCAGLIAPSQRADGDNLVIFVANLDIDDSTDPGPDGFPYPPGPPTDLTWGLLQGVCK
jgi:RES domain-containing protein